MQQFCTTCGCFSLILFVKERLNSEYHQNMKADFVQTMKILVLCEAVALFVCCVGYQENPNILGNTKQFWYNTLIRYKQNQSLITNTLLFDKLYQ